MNQDFKKCLNKKSIFAAPSANKFADKELSVALSDLKEAQYLFDNKRYKYCTVAAYYSMFHAARALLYSRGYKERSHRCLVAAMEALFVKNGLLEMRDVRNLRNAMSLREDADYSNEYSEAGAKESLIKAKEFIQKAQAILDNK